MAVKTIAHPSIADRRAKGVDARPVSCFHISITSAVMPARGVGSPGPERTVIDLSLAYAVMSTSWG